MSNLISQLARLIVQDNAVLFVGAALRSQAGQSPLVQQIADALAAQIAYQRPDRSLPAVARDYEVLRGRRALLQAVREQLQRSESHPAAIHQLIADAVLPSTKVITTRFDRILEQALDQTGKPYVLIVRDTDVPFFDESKVTLIKMQGDITQPDSLVLTEDDLDAFIDRLPTISDVVRAFFATKTLIFLGYDLQSPIFKRFYNHVTRKLTVYRRQAYAITPQALPAIEQQYWQQQNVTLCEREPLRFLQALAVEINEQVAAGVTTPPPLAAPDLPPPPAPYKGLAPFDEADRAIFVGRNEAAQQLKQRILANRITLLYGPAGVGKTSLVHAGLQPLLRELGSLLVDVLPGADLQAELVQAVRASAAAAKLELAATADVGAILRQLQPLLRGPLVLVLDPLDDLLGHEQAWPFLQELAADRSLDLRWLWVLRDDHLADLPDMQAWQQPTMLARFRLDRLSREAAYSAIAEPASFFDLEWEESALQEVLDGLEDPESQGILPAQLQLVCTALWQRLPSGERRITARLLHDNGGVSGLLASYLDHVISGLPADQQEAARHLLAALVSSGGERQRLSLAELSSISQIPPARAEALLAALGEQHVVRRRVFREGPLYELAHAGLTRSISLWLNESFWRAQKARELLRQQVPAWLQDGRLLPADDLREIAVLQGKMAFTPQALELLYASAVALAADAGAWAKLLAAERRCAVLHRLLQHADAGVRSRALRALAFCADAEAATTLARQALAADSAQERRAAAEGIAEALADDRPAAMQALLHLPEPDEPAFVQALATIRDAAPQAQALLPVAWRRQVQWLVWRRRWQRRWPDMLAATVQGAQGGFWGLGFSLGVLLALASYKNFGDFVDLRRTVGLLLAGLSLGGVIGALVGGGTAFVRMAETALADSRSARRSWLLATLTGTITFALGMVVIAFGARGPLQVGPTLAAGALLGMLMVGAATYPWPLSMGLRLLATMLAGVAAFLLVYLLQLSFLGAEWWWLLIAGLASGAGLFAGLQRWLSPAAPREGSR